MKEGPMSSAMDLTDRRFRAAKRNVLWRYVLALLAVTVLMVATSVPAEASKTARIGTPAAPFIFGAVGVNGGAGVLVGGTDF